MVGLVVAGVSREVEIQPGLHHIALPIAKNTTSTSTNFNFKYNSKQSKWFQQLQDSSTSIGKLYC